MNEFPVDNPETPQRPLVSFDDHAHVMAAPRGDEGVPDSLGAPLVEPTSGRCAWAERFAPSDAALRTLLFGASGLFFLWLLMPVLLGLTFTADDLLSQNLPLRKFYADCLHKGQSFLWTPDLYGGFYIHGEGLVGMMHPLHLLLYSGLPLTTAFGIEITLTYAFMFGGSYLLFRILNLGVTAALFGSFLFTFGGTNLVLLEHMNTVAVVANLPWVLAAIHRAFYSDHVRMRALWLSSVALLTGSQILLGYPQSVWFCVLIEAGFIAWLLTMDARWRRAAQISAALLVGLMIGAVQILPTMTASADSARAKPPMEFQAEMSLQPQELLQWINPLFWKGARYDQLRGFYDYLIYFGGTAALLLFAWLIGRKDLDRSRRKFAVFLAAVGIAGMFLALGKYNLVFPLYAQLPVIGLFRAPVRYTILTDFAVAAGAALALDHLYRVKGRMVLSPALRSVAVLMGVAAISSVFLVLAVQGSTFWPGGTAGALAQALPDLAAHVSSPLVAALGALPVCGGVLLFLLSGGNPRLARTALAAFVVLDVTCTQAALLLAHNPMGDPFPLNTLPVDPPGPVQSGYGDELLLLGYRLVDGSAALEPASPVPIGSVAYARIMGARAVMLDTWRPVSEPLPLVRLRNTARLLENRERLLADSSLIAQSRLMEHRYAPPGLDRDLDQVLHFDFAKGALVEEAVSLDVGATGTIAMTAEEPGRMRLTANVTGAMLATTGTRFHEAWLVWIDGRPAHTMRVDGSLLGFVVPTGSHRIEARFDPQDFRQGAMVSLSGLVLALLYPAVVFARRRDSGTEKARIFASMEKHWERMPQVGDSTPLIEEDRNR